MSVSEVRPSLRERVVLDHVHVRGKFPGDRGLGELVRLRKGRDGLHLPRHEENADHRRNQEESENHSDRSRTPDRGHQWHGGRAIYEEVVGSSHLQRHGSGQAELPNRSHPGEYGHDPIEIHGYAFLLRLLAVVNGDEGAERNREAPVQVGDHRGDDDGADDDLRRSARQARNGDDAVFEDGSIGEDEAQRQHERHLHRELKEHPQAAVVRIHGLLDCIAEHQRRDGQDDHHDDGGSECVRHIMLGNSREAIHPARRVSAVLVLRRLRSARMAGVGHEPCGAKSEGSP